MLKFENIITKIILICQWDDQWHFFSKKKKWIQIKTIQELFLYTSRQMWWYIVNDKYITCCSCTNCAQHFHAAKTVEEWQLLDDIENPQVQLVYKHNIENLKHVFSDACPIKHNKLEKLCVTNRITV